MDNLRRFLVVFCAMLVLAAAVCGIILVRSYNDSNKEFVTELTVDLPTFDPSGQHVEKVFQSNILFIVNDDDDPVSHEMFLVNVDSVSGSLNFLLLPRELKYNVASAGTVGSFGSMYDSFSGNAAASCASAIASFFDIEISYYFRLTTEDVSKMINSFSSEDNGVLFDIPADVYFRDYERDININFKRGSRYLNGDDAVDFLSFYRTEDDSYTSEMLPYYDGTDVKRQAIVSKFIGDFIVQKFTEAQTDFYLKSFTGLMTPYIQRGETNLTQNQLEAVAEVLGSVNRSRMGFYIPAGDLSYNDMVYLEYNGFVKNMLLEENISASPAAEVFSLRFKTSY